jgi:hypothetical protein
MEITFRQLRIYNEASCLKRAWEPNLLVQLPLVLASAITLGTESRRTHDHKEWCLLGSYAV